MIRTVLGDISIKNSGNILMHEHIWCISNDMLSSLGDKWMDIAKFENYAVSVIKSIKENYGVTTFVDGTSIDLGRDAGLLKRVSEKSGVNIVASTGLYYFPSMLTSQRTADDLAEIFLYECENGLDGTDVKPGILKCAADGVLSDDTAKRLTAVSIVQSKTGLPMYAHCSHNDDIAVKMMRIFDNKKVNPEKTVFGHVSRRLETEYLETILKEGYYICIDQSFDGSEKAVAQTVFELAEKGYENKILFSHDFPLYNDFSTPDRTGKDFSLIRPKERIGFLYNKLLPELKRVGFSNNELDKFLKLNALEVLDYE